MEDYEDDMDLTEVFKKDMEDKYSSIIDKTNQIDYKALEFLTELINVQVEENKEEIILTTDPRRITILQGKIIGQRDLLKFISELKNVKSHF